MEKFSVLMSVYAREQSTYLEEARSIAFGTLFSSFKSNIEISSPVNISLNTLRLDATIDFP